MIGWLDLSAGASGDMLLGAVVDAGAPLEVLQAAVDALHVEPIRLTAHPVTRQGLAATKVEVEAPRTRVLRTWANIKDLLERSTVDDAVRARALDAFGRLARAEAVAHRTRPELVHFHEVGALDAIADVVGVAAGLHALGIESLTGSTVTLGSGMSRSEHGLLPVPGPAVLALLREVDAPVWSGPAPYEMCTPTGAALLASTVSSWGQLPPMVVRASGHGAGTRELDELPNLVRLVVGEPLPAAAAGGAAPPAEEAVVLEANVDDLDPRVWPHVLTRLLDAGAADAWLTPILMKKGRPAHTLSVLATPGALPDVRAVVFAETSTIGVRETVGRKRALDRETASVEVEGERVRVKVARLDGAVVNASVEYDDVLAAAAALHRPVKSVLAAAVAAADAAGLSADGTTRR